MTCHTVDTCAVSLQREWGSASSNCYSEQMTCYTLGNCTSWPHCGSACGWKGYHYLQMSSDTRHKIIFQTSSKITSFPFRISAPTAVNHKKLKYRSKHHFPFHKHQNSWHLLSYTSYHLHLHHQLARMKSNNFGMSLCTVDGQRYSLGEAQVSL